MKFVVAGALGHIGSKLIRELGESYPGSEIVMIDNLITQRYCSLFNLPETSNYNFIEKNILDCDLPEILEGSNMIFQLAAITDATSSFENKEKVEQNNFYTTKKIAEACCNAKVPLVHLSSTSVYGTQKNIVDEFCTEEELQPQSPYAETKLREEKLLQRLALEKDLKFITLRFGTICGVSSGMRFHTAINKFCWQAVMNQPLTVWETALHQKRPYLTLEDAMLSFKLIINRQLFDCQVYNILTANLTVNDIIESIKKHTNDLNIEFVVSKIMNQLSYEVSRKRIEDKGFTFVGSIDKAVSDTINILKGANFKRFHL